jgi:hypothetical protein
MSSHHAPGRTIWPSPPRRSRFPREFRLRSGWCRGNRRHSTSSNPPAASRPDGNDRPCRRQSDGQEALQERPCTIRGSGHGIKNTRADRGLGHLCAQNRPQLTQEASIMKLNAYGLLIGKITASRPKRPESPHWLLFVQPSDPNHPAYRVAVNLQTTERKHKPELQYQIVEFGRRSTPAGSALIKKLTALGFPKSFLAAEANPTIPRLDFARGGFLNPKKFQDLRPGAKTLETEFKKTVAEAQKSKALVAVFGSGYPVDPQTRQAVPTGFTGIENIHMNQGTKNFRAARKAFSSSSVRRRRAPTRRAIPPRPESSNSTIPHPRYARRSCQRRFRASWRRGEPTARSRPALPPPCPPSPA